jgi:hypothetical protein
MRLLQATAAVLVIAATPAFCQRVTETARVKIDGRVETVRKINGRWWSSDNRQLQKPKDGSFIWWITSGAPPEFYHHRPVDLSQVESLHLFMNQESVRTLLGDPNETISTIGIWRYYAEDGTAVLLRFFSDQLGQAKYERAGYGAAGRPVQSVAAELNGRDIFAILADQNWQRNSPAAYAKFKGARGAAVSPVTETHVYVEPPAPKRRIAKDLVDAVHAGMTRAEVVEKLGDPGGGLRIGGQESETEDLSYPLDPSGQVTISLKNGKVVKVSR